MKSVSEIRDVKGLRVLVRNDFNTPMKGGEITDDGRIRAALPTLKYLLDGGARVTIMAHLGKPKGQVDPKKTLAPVAARLSELLGQPVPLAGDTAGPESLALSEGLGDGEICMIQNIRFDAGEESKDEAVRFAFAQRLAQLGDVFVSDGFGVVHRKHTSVYDIARLLPSYAGGLVEAETKVLKALTDDPKRPFVVVLGGAKVADKLLVIENLLKIADTLVIGGGMAFTFLAAQGYQIGKSILDADNIEACKGYLATAEAAGKKIILPVDARIAPGIDFETGTIIGAATVVPIDAIPDDQAGYDIGPESETIFVEAVLGAHTVFWNGPMGVFEVAEFTSGTAAIAKALTEVDGLSVVGGGDSAAAVRDLGFADEAFGHISTGGGASLEYLEGKDLPGISVLED